MELGWDVPFIYTANCGEIEVKLFGLWPLAQMVFLEITYIVTIFFCPTRKKLEITAYQAMAKNLINHQE